MSQPNDKYRLNNKSNFGNNTNKRFIFRKREPAKPLPKKSDVFVTNKSNFKCNLERIEKLWNKGETEITVHALGAAIPRAINVCLQFQKDHYNVLELDVTTGTVDLIDDFEPLTEEDDFEFVTRRNSSVCIKLIRKINPSSNSSE